MNQAVTEANGSSIDLTRALEQFLRKYPNSARRAEIEASLYKTAVDSNDYPRIVTYGEKVLLGHPDNELDMLDRVIRSMLVSEDAASAKKALDAPDVTKSPKAFRAASPRRKGPMGGLADRALAQAVLSCRAYGARR